MYENIEGNRPNFCIGPQSGTFCIVDDSADPVVMYVKNSSGVLIRTYSFYPSNILKTDGSSELPYHYYKFLTIKYVGPRDQSSYFDGAIFYTLEKRAFDERKYYTYDDEEAPLKTKDRI